MSVALVFDDAAIFPPGNLPLAEAVAAHRAHRDALYGHLVGPLVLGASDLGSLRVDPHDGPLDIAVVVADATAAAAAAAAVRTRADLRLRALEITDAAVPEVRAAIGDPDGITVYLEVPRDERRPDVIAALAGTAYRAKLRTGGTTAAAYPDEAELATAVVALARAGVRFKATAGLHHALRNTDPLTGFEQHGFLNLLAATDGAVHGAEVAEVAAVLAIRDVGDLTVPSTTSLFGSVGTCDLIDPITELADLGLPVLEEIS